jgi:hypothetical protein
MLGILLVAALAYYGALNARILTLPGPQEFHESVMPLTTGLILAGGRPYALANTPAVANIYGVVYNYLLVPPSAIWGPTFLVHRAGSLVFLLAGAAVLFSMLRRNGVGHALALGGAALYYLINATTYALAARPDTLGGALMLAATWLVMPDKNQKPPSVAKMVSSAAVGILAFYTKAYFLLALPLAAAGLLMISGWKRAFLYTVIAVALGLASVLVVNQIWPEYLFSIYTTHVYTENAIAGFFLSQLLDFVYLHAGLLALAALMVAMWLQRRNQSTALPLGRRWRPTPAAMQLLVAVAAMLFILGTHSGAFRIYWVQMVTPFLLLAGLGALAQAEGWRKPAGLGLLALNAVILLTWARPPWPQDSAPTWQAWQELTADRPWQLLPLGLLPDVARKDAPLAQDGQTIYFANVALDHLPPEDPAYQRVVKYLTDLQTAILARRFDVLAGPNEFWNYVPKQLLLDHYEKRMVTVPVYFSPYHEPENYGQTVTTYEVWLRKPGPEHAFTHQPITIPPGAAPMKPEQM